MGVPARTRRIASLLVIRHISLFAGISVETVADMEKEVGRDYVAHRFGARLGIDCVSDVAELLQHVVAVDGEHKRALEHRFAHTCVPHHIGGVKSIIGKTTTRV